MALQVGSRLGHYDVTALIGEGGMGQVYQATDTKLKRQVALKILPEAFSADPERLARFQREAEVLASLNHPNIAAIYGLEEADDTRALVLELVEGPTLADRIKKGPIPLDEALPIAKQIAEALEVAHEAGVIHRDLKPANIKVKEDGTVKVLDFGLAKALDPSPTGDPSQSPTLTAAATQMGVIMGTAAYMSPEQARGKPVDRRTDIWAFSAVLFEMLTGKRAFEGEDVSVTLANVINQSPNWDQLPDEISPSLQTYLRRCLEKDSTKRVQAIGDVRLALEGAFETTAETPATETAASHAVSSRAGLLAALGAVLLAAATGWTVWTLTYPETPSVARFSIRLPPGVQMSGAVRLTRDGQTVAFIGQGDGHSQVYIRALDELEAVPLRGSEDISILHNFLPDGRVLYGSEGGGTTMKRLRVDGSSVETVLTDQHLHAVWRPDETVVYGSPEGLWLATAGSDERTQLTAVSEDELFHEPTEFLPNGRLLFWVNTGVGAIGNGRVAVYDFESDEHRVLVPGRSPRFASTGHLIFWRDDALWAVLFDPDDQEVRGDPVRVVDGVTLANQTVGSYALADSGTLAYGSGDLTATTLGWVNRRGEMIASVTDGMSIAHPTLSPDGTRVVLGQDGDLWVRELASGRDTRLTETSGFDVVPTWTPTGSAVAFASGDASVFLHSRPTDLSSSMKPLLSTKGSALPGSWTPDGQALVYYTVNDQGDRDIWTLPVDGEPVPFLATDANERAPRLSPDGRWLAYISDQSGEDRVFAQAYPSGGERFSVSTGSGTEPVWSRDGRELFYRTGNEVWAVNVDTDTGFRPGVPRLLFEAPYISDFIDQGNPNYDVSLDGEQFLMVRGNADAALQLVVVQNWFEELKRLVPSD